MGGVDLSDQLVSAYIDERKTMKVWKKVVFNLVQKMVINSYILYKKGIDVPCLSRLAYCVSKDFLTMNKIMRAYVPERSPTGKKKIAAFVLKETVERQKENETCLHNV